MYNILSYHRRWAFSGGGAAMELTNIKPPARIKYLPWPNQSSNTILHLQMTNIPILLKESLFLFHRQFFHFTCLTRRSWLLCWHLWCCLATELADHRSWMYIRMMIPIFPCTNLLCTNSVSFNLDYCCRFTRCFDRKLCTMIHYQYKLLCPFSYIHTSTFAHALLCAS